MYNRNFWYSLWDDLPVIGGVLVIAAVIALGIFAAVNAAPVLVDGRVADMSFSEAKTELVFYATTDSNGHVTTRSQPVHYPNMWRIQVIGTKENGEPRSEWWEIGEGMYALIGIGDTVHRDTKLGVVSIVRKAVAEDAAHGD